jgi:hypothetical protein
MPDLPDDHAEDLITQTYARLSLPPCPRCGGTQFRGGISHRVRCQKPWCGLPSAGSTDRNVSRKGKRGRA